MKTEDKQLSTCPKALRQALTPIEPKRLPTNFAYKTMQRIRREQVEADRREQIIAIATIVTVSVLGIAVFVYFFGRKIWQSFRTTFIQSDTVARQVQGRNGIKETCGQSAQSAVAQGWFFFFALNVNDRFAGCFENAENFVVKTEVD